MSGKREVASAIINSEGWISALKSEFISSVTGVRETPLRLLIKHFPDLAKRVFDRCMITNLQSDEKQISKQVMSTVSSDDPNFTITLNYELLDDAYCLFKDTDDEDSANSVKIDLESVDGGDIHNANQVPWYEGEIWDENNHLLPEAKPYTDTSSVLKLNHPLMLMVKEQRTNLLGHPLCMALVRHKWNSFGRYVYYFTLALYFMFVLFLTDFTVNTPAPYSARQIVEYGEPVDKALRKGDVQFNLTNIINMNKNEGFGSVQTCERIREIVNVEQRKSAKIGKIIIFALAIFHLIRELFQITQVINYMMA